jgi:hypothetical protein
MEWAKRENILSERYFASSKETIILVHGTFASPSQTGPLKWYQPGHDFCTQLDNKLAELGCPARCWAHCPPEGVFWWSGENSWIARSKAADDLANYLAKYLALGWKCHIVAHSHGGNVVLEALRTLGRHRLQSAGFIQSKVHGQLTDEIEHWVYGHVVLLGTPILERSDIARVDSDSAAKATSPTDWSAGITFIASIAALTVLFLNVWPTASQLLSKYYSGIPLIPHSITVLGVTAFTSIYFNGPCLCSIPLAVRRGIFWRDSGSRNIKRLSAALDSD